MNEEPISLGAFLRRERERRGVTLKSISDQTKVSVPLLAGLEADDLSRWPGGIFRRAFVRAYATCVGLDPDLVVRRLEEQHPVADEAPVMASPAPPDGTQPAEPPAAVPNPTWDRFRRAREPRSPRRARLLGTAADVTVAVVLGLGSAAAGSRMLWPVVLIAAYYALGTLLTGTSPMVALLADEGASEPVKQEPQEPVVARGPSRKGRLENAAREARHEGTPRRRHGRLVTSPAPRGIRS